MLLANKIVNITYLNKVLKYSIWIHEVSMINSYPFIEIILQLVLMIDFSQHKS